MASLKFINVGLLIFVFLYLKDVNGLTMDPKYFHASVLKYCYESSDQTNSIPVPLHMAISQNARSSNIRIDTYQKDIYKNGPLSQSVETLIALIEKIENKYYHLRADQLAVMLLKRWILKNFWINLKVYWIIFKNSDTELMI